MPFDKLKVDRTFIEEMAKDDSAAILVRTVVSMAKTLGLEVVAEGVETEEQAKMLAAFGCGFGQGHHFGKAAPGIDYHPAPAPLPKRCTKPTVVAEGAPAPVGLDIGASRPQSLDPQSLDKAG